MPSERLRKLEIDANYAFDQYREMYFDGGVSSVYLWDLEHGFAGIVFFFFALPLSWPSVFLYTRCNFCFFFSFIRRSNINKESWRWLKKDTRLLGFDSRCRGAREVQREKCSLQINLHYYAVASDE